MNMLKFKPNLIPNSKVDNPINIPEVISGLGRTISDYIISFKKDGCRVEIIDGTCKSRELKEITSKWIQDRYRKLAQVCQENGVILEGEFYAHGMRFNEIVRFFKTEDVTDPKHIKKLEADRFKFNLKGTKKEPIWYKAKTEEERISLEKSGHESKFMEDWPGRTVEWLSTYHEDLKIWPFDLYLPNYPDLCYYDRMKWFHSHVISTKGIFNEFKDILELGEWYNAYGSGARCEAWKGVEYLYEKALNNEWEGLVLAYKHRTYKFNRSTAAEADLFKMKEDKLEYDGKVLDIVEGTVAREGAPKTTNKLGRSVTSKLAEDRIPSGMASGILSEYEGHSITVSFEGYSHDELREILINKEQYIGQWFKYTGMKPVKNVPRHAHCLRNSFRDSKGDFEN